MLGSPRAQFPTTPATDPEVQAMRVVDGAEVALTSSFRIYVDTSIPRYVDIAAILNEQLDSLMSVTLTVADLTTRIENQNQIVLGNVSNATIAALAATHGRSTLGLGTEGYDLTSLPNPNSTNGSWLVFIAANDPAGVLHGVFTLSDLLADGTPGSIGNLRIRDYPVHPHREVQHWIPNVDTQTPQRWLDKRTREFREIAASGANAVSLGRSDFFRMGDPAYGLWLKQAIDAARYYGLEPIPEVHWPPPSTWEFPYAWAWREGELIENESFVVGPDWVLQPVDTFDNAAHNMSFDATDASGWPLRWKNMDDPGDWIADSSGGDVWLEYAGPGTRIARVKTYIDTLSGPRMEPASFYVLEATFSGVSWSSEEAPEIDLFAEVGPNAPQGCQSSSPPPSAPPNTVSLLPWACFRSAKFEVRKSPTGNPDGPFTVDYYFWTPPTYQDAPSGYGGPFFDDIFDIFLQIRVPAGISGFSMKVHGFVLERRAASLRNVMTAASLPDWDLTDLPLTIKKGAQTYSEGADYTLFHRPPNDYLMETHPDSNNVSVIKWNNSSLVGETVEVSYTLGVPADWSGGQATTYCLKSPGFLGYIRGLLEGFYIRSYEFDPKFINVRLDEIRGMNRCSRCIAAGDNNSMHIVTYLKDIQAMLDDIALQDTTAANARMVVYAGPMWPANIGREPEYQYSWGGQWGASQAKDSAFAHLNNSNADLILNTRFQYYEATRTPSSPSTRWPGAYLQTGQSVSTIGHMIFEEAPPPGEPQLDLPELAGNATWYEDDCEGFLTASAYYNDNTQTDAEKRLQDYAWKRYQNPHAGLHVFRDSLFAGEAGDTVLVAPFTVLEFVPFGSAEVRDSTLQDPIVLATIDWGNGLPPVDVFEQLNAGVLPHQWIYGTRDVTLEVRTQTGATNTATVTVTVDTSDPDITLWSGNVTLAQDYVVDAGKTLIVAPGTRVTATAPVGITVHGALGVAGTAGSPVEFCASDTTDPGAWAGILIHASVDTARSVIEHCLYRNANGGLGARGALTIRHTTIWNCGRLGLSVAGSDSTYASHVTIRDITRGVTGEVGVQVLDNARARLDSCTIENMYIGANVYAQGTMYASQSTFQRHDGEALWVTQSGRLFLDGCVVDSSSVGIYGTASAAVDVRGSTFKNSGNGLSLFGTSLVAVIEGCTFENNETGAYISGAPGVSITGSTFENSSGEGIYCLSGSNITIDSVTVFGGTIGIKVDASSPVIEDCSIHDNTGGIHCEGPAAPVLRRNNLVDNTNGITTMSGATPVLDHCGGSCSQSCANANTIRGGTGYRYSNLDPSFTADAECTYWGRGSKVPASWFYGPVDYTPALSQDPIAPVASQFEREQQRLPATYGLSANYPNPFNPATTIAFEVPPPGGRVSIQVYNVAGQRVATLLDGHVVPGYHTTTWTGVNRRGNAVSSGMYFVQMRARGFVETRKLLLLK